MDQRNTLSSTPAHTPERSATTGFGRREQDAFQDIRRSQERLMMLPRDTLNREDARLAVTADLAALSLIRHPGERLFAAMALADNVETQAAYRAELTAQSPRIAVEIDAAAAESARRALAKDQRKSGMQNPSPAARDSEDERGARLRQQRDFPSALVEVLAAIMRARGDSAEAIALVFATAADRLAAGRDRASAHRLDPPTRDWDSDRGR